ncbi:MAG: hypothetical protein E7I10_24510, partial [Enterobacter asburiae]|nr:hypothetical protein [Enterobacter asburiae]
NITGGFLSRFLLNIPVSTLEANEVPLRGKIRPVAQKPESRVENGCNTQIFLMIKSRLIQRIYCVQLNAP